MIDWNNVQLPTPVRNESRFWTFAMQEDEHADLPERDAITYMIVGSSPSGVLMDTLYLEGYVIFNYAKTFLEVEAIIPPSARIEMLRDHSQAAIDNIRIGVSDNPRHLRDQCLLEVGERPPGYVDLYADRETEERPVDDGVCNVVWNEGTRLLNRLMPWYQEPSRNLLSVHNLGDNTDQELDVIGEKALEPAEVYDLVLDQQVQHMDVDVDSDTDEPQPGGNE